MMISGERRLREDLLIWRARVLRGDWGLWEVQRVYNVTLEHLSKVWARWTTPAQRAEAMRRRKDCLEERRDDGLADRLAKLNRGEGSVQDIIVGWMCSGCGRSVNGCAQPEQCHKCNTTAWEPVCRRTRVA